jgi:hypothetical protein
VDRLCNLRVTDSQDGPRPFDITVSEEASALLYAFMQWIEPQLGFDGDLRDICDWTGKLAGAVSRICGVLHAVKHCHLHSWQQIPISADTIQSAITIGRYCIPHARAALRMMESSAETQQAQCVLAWLKRHQLATFRLRDAQQALRRQFARQDDMNPALKLLIDANYIRPIKEPVGTKVGRTAGPSFEVNPRAFDLPTVQIRNHEKRTQNTQNSGNGTLAPPAGGNSEHFEDAFCAPDTAQQRAAT